MGKRKGNVNPHLRIRTPYTRFASDFWACYKAYGHHKAVISKPRFDRTERKILFEFFEDIKAATKLNTGLISRGNNVVVCGSSARSALFDFCKDTKPVPVSDSTVRSGAPSVTQVVSPDIGFKNPRTDNSSCNTTKLTLTAPTCEPLEPLNLQPLPVLQRDDEVDILPDPDQNIPLSGQTVDVTTSPGSYTRERQGRIIGFMSKIISEKWASCDSDLKEEYRRQTAEEKSTFLETMIAVHLRHGFPLPPVRIEESRCMNMLFKSLYQWYKQNQYILDLGYPGRVGSDPVIATLRAKCAKFMKKETEQFKQMFASKTVINLDMTTDLVDHVDKDIMEYADNVISTPGTISTPHSPQFVQSDQLSSGCSSLDDAVASSTPEKSSPESEPSTCTPIIKIPSGFQGQRTYHTIEPCYTPPPKAMNLRPGSGNSLHPLSPPLTPVLAAKLPGSNFVRPPPQPPSMLYSLYGMGQISEDNNTADKPSRSTWSDNTSPAVTHVTTPFGNLYSLPPRILYPGYQFQWSTELPSLTPYPLSTPALQEPPPDLYLPPPAPLSPSTAQGSPVQGHEMYFSQPSSYFNNGNF